MATATGTGTPAAGASSLTLNAIRDRVRTRPIDALLAVALGTLLLILLAAWGECPATPCIGDLDGNGVVDVADLLLLLSNWS